MQTQEETATKLLTIYGIFAVINIIPSLFFTFGEFVFSQPTQFSGPVKSTTMIIAPGLVIITITVISLIANRIYYKDKMFAKSMLAGAPIPIFTFVAIYLLRFL